MYDAHMISRAGDVIPVRCHPYFYRWDRYHDLEMADWLYGNITDPGIKAEVMPHFIILLSSYCKDVIKVNALDESYKELCTDLAIPVDADFMEEHLGRVQRLMESDKLKGAWAVALSKLDVVLNSWFIRERYGGLYESNHGDKNIYFRITKYWSGWEYVIKEFIENFDGEIETVTVVKDAESNGLKDNEFYFCDWKGTKRMMRELPLKTFKESERFSEHL